MFEHIYRQVLRRRGLSIWSLVAIVMWVASLVYRCGYYLHRTFTKEKITTKVPIVSVGNITVGGTGKTPLVAFLAQYLMDDGFRVGIVSSGYGRKEVGRAVLEPGYRIQTMAADEVGDEVLLLATLLPNAVFSVHRSKTAGAEHLAATDQVDLMIIDDGFQHWRLSRTIDLITFDAAVPRRMLRWFPLGLLREPQTALARAQIIVATRSNFAQDISQVCNNLARHAPEASLYRAQFVTNALIGKVDKRPLKYLEDKAVYLFAGIGNFKPLRRQVSALCNDLDVALELGDHQVYDLSLLERIRDEAEQHDSDVILTTGKDWVKLPDFDFGRELYYLDQAIDLDPGEELLIRDLKERLNLPARSTDGTTI